MEFKFNTKGRKTRLRVTEAAFRNSFDVEAIHPFNDVWATQQQAAAATVKNNKKKFKI